MDLSLLFAGTAGSVPTQRRGLPATLLRAGGDRILFDCGEGTQRQLLRSRAGLPEIDAVFITHFHADHWLGLPGMLKTFDLRDREVPLGIYGPPGLSRLMATVIPLVGRTLYETRVEELDRYDDPVEFDGYVVEPFPVDHRGGPAYGYRFQEDDRPGRFDPELAERLGVEPGPDFGRLQRGETVAGVSPEQVVGPPRPGRKVVLSGDTRPCQTLVENAQEADLLIHEATFLHSERERARHTGHSTARQAAEIALEAGVKQLALTHLSIRHFPREARAEAEAVFGRRVWTLRDFDVATIPFPERGELEWSREGHLEPS